MAKVQKKKGKITRNKVIGSIQLTIGILLLMGSILGIISMSLSLKSELEINTSPYTLDYMSAVQNRIMKVINSSEMSNSTKDIILNEYEIQSKIHDMDWYAEKNYTFIIIGVIFCCCIITSLLSLLFITQGIVNFGLDKLKHE